jgi:hypothetical protein
VGAAEVEIRATHSILYGLESLPFRPSDLQVIRVAVGMYVELLLAVGKRFVSDRFQQEREG